MVSRSGCRWFRTYPLKVDVCSFKSPASCFCEMFSRSNRFFNCFPTFMFSSFLPQLALNAKLASLIVICRYLYFIGRA